MDDEYLVNLVNDIEEATVDVELEGYMELDTIKAIKEKYAPYALKIVYEIENDPCAEDDGNTKTYATGLIIWLKNGLVIGVGMDEGGGTFTYIRPIGEFDYTHYKVPRS